MILGPLYHWSPTDRRESIQCNGLVPGSPVSIATTELPHICLGFDPASAWGISGAVPWASGESWDLWMIRLDSDDVVSIRPEFGPRLQEVVVANQIAAERCWFVGQRKR